MPSYTYQCNCGVRFEKILPMKDHNKAQVCPDCGEFAEQQVPEKVHGSFQMGNASPLPQNTGVSKVDTDYDRAIGSSAKAGWAAQEKRDKEKINTIQATGAELADLSLNPDGTYHVLAKEERGVFERGNAINQKAMEVLTK